MNILTFDVEEWFHILDNESTKTVKEWTNYEYRLESNMERIFDLLDRKQQKATFFCLGWVAREFPSVLKKINSHGYEIASHSDQHQLAYNQSRGEFKSDLELSVKSIEDIIGLKVKSYRAPGFSITEENEWVFEELLTQGIEVDCSIFPSKRSHGGFKSYGCSEPSIINYNNFTVKEFPINLYNLMGKNIIFSGGGYFRLLPYWVIKKMMSKSGYVMTYFHPRDFDGTQPIINDLSVIRKFKSYYGLSSAFVKLEKLIVDFDFIDLDTAVRNTNWNKVNRITL
jgi:peptidoglycan-N-acetylglucosamine deacetylase